MEKLQSPPIITLVIPHHHGITVKGKTLEDFRQEYVVGKDDGAGRFKTTAPMQSFVVDMVQGASSKNSETVRAMIQRFPQMVPDFEDSINTIFCDQEFAPSMFLGFFQSLKSNNTEDRSSCLPVLAIGHLIKNIVHTVPGTYYQPSKAFVFCVHYHFLAASVICVAIGILLIVVALIQQRKHNTIGLTHHPNLITTVYVEKGNGLTHPPTAVFNLSIESQITNHKSHSTVAFERTLQAVQTQLNSTQPK